MKCHPRDAICSADLDGSIGYEPPEQELTHLISANAVSVNRNQFYALCGARVADHQGARNGDPTCPDCKRIDEDDDRTALSLTQELSQPLERPVKSTWFDPTAGYRPKGSRR
jgi:hypothetical protein